MLKRSIGRSVNRKFPYAPSSAAPSARSWVYPYNQPSSTLPPPQPIDLPSPVEELEHLPNPFPRSHKSGHKELRVVNATPYDELERGTNALGMDFGFTNESLTSEKSSQKKKSIIGRVFKGVGRFQNLFGSGSEIAGTRKLKHRVTNVSNRAQAGSTFFENTSQPSILPGDSGPSNMGLHLHHPDMTIPELPESEDPATPPPQVFRLSDTLPGTSHPRFNDVHRVPSGSRNTGRREGPSRFVNSHMVDSSHNNNNLVERTTVMIFDQNADPKPQGLAHTSSLVSRQPSSGVSPSYVNSESAPLPPLQPLRPASVAPSLSRVPTLPEQGSFRRTSITSPAAPRSRPLSVVHRRVLNQAPFQNPEVSRPIAPEGQPVMVPTAEPPLTSTIPLVNPGPIQSPVSAHPLPTDDYMKMTLSPDSKTATSGTSFSYDPSFSSDLSPFARFFKAFYRMPWISHDRVTVDYLPDMGLIGSRMKAKKRKVKRLSTWYRSMVARSRRSSATIDLLGNEEYRKRKERHTKSRRRHRHHHSSSSRHHHRHHPHHHRYHESKRQTTTTMDSDDSAFESNPLMPATMYPFPFSSYPIAGYAPFQLATPGYPPAQGENALSSASPLPQPTMANIYAAPQGGYASYQPLVAPTPLYVYQPQQGVDVGSGMPTILVPGAVDTQHPAVKTSGGSMVPPVLVPGKVDEEHGTSRKPPSITLKTTQLRPTGSVIPGAFS